MRYSASWLYRFLRLACSAGITALVLTACQQDAPSQLAGIAGARDLLVNASSIPHRNQHAGGPYWSDVSDSAVWAGGARHDSVFMIGFKAPGAARGFWHGKLLVDHGTVRNLREGLLQQFGLKLKWADSVNLPQAEVHVPNLAVLSRIRNLPFIDYIEPATIEILPFSSGCGPEPLTKPIITVPASTGGLDTLSAIMTAMGIPDAWLYSRGDGVLIGFTGEGVDDSYDAPFGSGHYAAADSYGRQPFYQNTNGSGPDASPQCDHETRLANIAAAPRDGHGVVGIAYRANVYSNYFEDGVYNTDEAAAADAVYYTGVYAHAKVITMAWGSLTGNNGISDTIDNLYYNYDVMFVGAAGTCWGGTGYCPNMGSAVFPASKGEVLAATGANWDGTRPTDNYDYGAKIEGVLTYTTLATVGLGVGTASDLNGSSASTGVIAGVAALVRSRYPWLNAHDAMYRILNTDYTICRDPPHAWRPGMVNALAAVGGPCILQINGPTTVSITAPDDYTTADYSVTVIGDNSANYTYSWSTQHPGSTTTAYFYANGWTPYESYVSVTATDPATGASVTRTLNVYVDSNDGGGGACGRPYC